MIAEQIRVNPFAMYKIICCEIKKEPNAHGQAYLKGYLSLSEKECMRLLSEETDVQIEAVGENGNAKVIFVGKIRESKIKRENQMQVLELKLVSYTWLMDLEKRIRSFQAEGISYQEILDTVMGAYPGGGCILVREEKRVTEELIVQYQETDWEFVKRLASHLQTVIVPQMQTPGVRIYAGLPERSTGISCRAERYIARKQTEDYLYKQQNQVEGLLEEDELCYVLEEQEILELGEQVDFLGVPYCVVGIESHMEGHQLWNTYLVKRQAGVRVPKGYNERIVGASMDGRITAIQEAQVKVKLSADGVEGEGRWFPFSTVYSSPDGSGWYCMPQVGDEIRLYFPTVKEKHAYVISAVHLPVEEGTMKGAALTSASGSNTKSTGQTGGYSDGTGGGVSSYTGGTGSVGNSYSSTAVATGTANTAMQQTTGQAPANNRGIRTNPEEKTIRTETGKMIKLTPTQIHLSNGKGLDIILDDMQGILISSDKIINIRSDDTINIASGSGIELIGMEKVQLKHKNSSLMLMEEIVKIKGAEVRMQ